MIYIDDPTQNLSCEHKQCQSVRIQNCLPLAVSLKKNVTPSGQYEAIRSSFSKKTQNSMNGAFLGEYTNGDIFTNM